MAESGGGYVRHHCGGGGGAMLDLVVACFASPFGAVTVDGL